MALINPTPAPTISYGLYFEEKTIIKDPENPSVYTVNDNSTTVTIKVVLHTIAFNRKLYSPNELNADVQVTNTSDGITFDQLEKLFVNKGLKLIIFYGSAEYQSFDKLYIHHIIPVKDGAALYVRLKVYSWDHQLTTRKFSQTYVGKRLGKDVLNTKLNYTKDSETKDMNLVSEILCNKKLQLAHKTNPLQHTSFSGTRTVNGASQSTVEEIILPYLVQYNESFYDFFARTANRCGEFLYYEEGEMHYGIHTPTSTLDSEIKDSDCTQIYVKKLPHIDDEYVCQEEVNETWSGNTNEDYNINWTKDKKAEKVKTSSDPLKYNFEINEEPYNTRIFKKKFSKPKLFFDLSVGKYWWGMIGTALAQVNIFNLLSKLSSKMALDRLNAEETSKYMQKSYENGVYNTLKTTDEVLQVANKDGDKESTTPFVAQTKVADNAFYMNIRKGELKASEQAVTFNLGSNIKRFELGQTIKYNSKDYIVVQIKLDPLIDMPLNKYDPDCSEDLKNMPENSKMQVIAVPVYTKDNKNIIYPPMIPTGHVRYAEPQVAYVASCGYMESRMEGRLRIHYPWETKDAEPSPWIRIMVPSAVSGGGFHAEANDGDEVLVCYEGGNIERPYVGGYLRHRANQVNFKKGGMYMISKNGHGVGFDDPTDPTLFVQGVAPVFKLLKTLGTLFFPASSGVMSFLGADPTADVSDARKAFLKSTGSTTITDAYGIYTVKMSSHERKIDINSPFGTVGINAFTGITLNAPNGNISIKGQNVSIEAGNSLKLVSGKNVKEGTAGTLKKLNSSALAVMGMTVADAVADFLKSQITLVDMATLRCVAEVFVRPINGTLQIKSNNYLLLEAGPGTATIRPNRYIAGTAALSKMEKDAPKKYGGAVEATNKIFEISHTYCTNIALLISGGIITIKRAKTAYTEKVQALNGVLTKYPRPEEIIKTAFGGNPKDYMGNPDAQQEFEFNNNNANQEVNAEAAAEGGQANNNNADNNNADVEKRNLYRLADQINNVITIYKQSLSLITEDLNNNNSSNHFFNFTTDANKPETALYPVINKKAKPIFTTKIYDVYYNVDKLITELNKSEIDCENALNTIAKKMEADLVKQVILANDEHCVLVAKQTENWNEFIASIQFRDIEEPKKSTMEAVKKGLEDTVKGFTKPYTEFTEIWKDYNVWKSEAPGQIIFSDHASRSSYFDKYGGFQTYANGKDFDLEGVRAKLSLLAPPEQAAAAQVQENNGNNNANA